MRRGNGDGGIFKLSGKRKKPFAVRVTTGWTSKGKQIYKYLGYYENKTQAKKALQEYLIKPYSLDKKTLQDVFNEWEKVHKLSDGTFKNYSTMFKNLTYIHNKEMRKLKLIDLEKYMLDLTPSMKKRYKNLMNNLYQYAIRHEIVDKNIAELLELDQIISKQKTILTLEEINTITDDVLIILLYTGTRINEILKLKSKNVNLEERYILTGSKTKSGKNRKIPIHKKLIPIFEKHLASNNTYAITEKGKPIKYENFNRKLKNEKYTAHVTRHTFITQATKCGMNPTILSRIVGHSDTNITNHYTHFDFSEFIEAIDNFYY